MQILMEISRVEMLEYILMTANIRKRFNILIIVLDFFISFNLL